MVMGLGQKPYFGTVQYTRDKEETRKNGWYENHSARSLVMKVRGKYGNNTEKKFGTVTHGNLR
jgi:hypothetical protein